MKNCILAIESNLSLTTQCQLKVPRDLDGLVQLPNMFSPASDDVNAA